MASPSQLIVLSNTISEGTAIVNEYFLSHNLPMPSFDVSGPPRVVIPSHEKRVAAAYAEVLRATIELHNLLLGPTAILMSSSVREKSQLHIKSSMS